MARRIGARDLDHNARSRLALVRVLRAHLVLDQSAVGVLAVGPSGADGGDEAAGVGGVAVALHCRSFDVFDYGRFSRSANQVLHSRNSINERASASIPL